MPTYQYACTACDERLEVVQTFSEAALTECPVCRGRLRKVFSAVGVVFKGSGFYKNDSRSGSGDSSPKSDSKGDSKGDKPAEKAAPAASNKADSSPSTPSSSSGSATSTTPAA